MKNIFFSIALLLICNHFFGQYSDEYLQKSSKYPDQGVVQIFEENIVSVDFDEDKVVVNKYIKSVNMHLKRERAVNLRDQIVFSDFKKIEDVKASVFNYRKGKYKESKIKDFTLKDEISDHFYDDQKSYNFVYPNVRSGTKTSLEYRAIIENPRFIGSFFFANYFPIENYSLEFRVNKAITMDFLTFNLDSLSFQYSESEKGREKIYRWEIKESPAFSYERDAVDPRYFLPHIIPVVKYFVKEQDTTFVLNSTKDLYQWYHSLVAGVNQGECDPNLSSLVDSLTQNCNSDYDKVKAIYYWTQKNIKYVAFEDGLGGFVPREANDVFNKKYGDCKDNSSILFQMLKVAGIDGHLTWVGTRDIPYKYDEVHTPAVDNHMILTYKNNGEVFFLDATGRYLSLDMPSSFIQGKEALIALDDNYQIYNVPIVSPGKNKIVLDEEIKIEDNSIVGNATRMYSGYEKINLFNALERYHYPKELKNFYVNELKSGNNSFLVHDIVETNKYDYDKDFEVAYSYSVNNQVREIGDALYINLNLHQDDVRNLKFDEPIMAPVEFTHKYSLGFHTNLIVPDNYSVKSLPENFIIDNDLCEVSIEYSYNQGMITYSHLFKTKFLTLDKVQQKEFQDIIVGIQNKYKDTVVLQVQK